MNVLSLFKDVVSETSETLTFVEARCLRRRLNSCDCTYCLDSCPAEALSLDGRNIQLDSEKCSRCMRCIAVCPNDAFELPGHNFEKHFLAVQDKDLTVFSCSRQSQIHPGETVVPCMGIFSPEILLLLGMTGPSIAAFNISECSGCENKVVSDAFLYSLVNLQKHGSALLTTKFTILTDPDQINPLEQENRRFFLSGLKNNLISAANSQLWKMQEEIVESSPTDRRITWKAQLIEKLLALVDDDKKALLSALCMYRLTAGKECTLCPRCTGICPTGALKVGRLNGEKQLLFKSTICSGCGLCVSFCKEKAITLTSPLIYKKTERQDVNLP